MNAIRVGVIVAAVFPLFFRVLPCLASLWCGVEAAAAASLEAAAAALFGRVGSRHAVLLLRENQRDQFHNKYWQLLQHMNSYGEGCKWF